MKVNGEYLFESFEEAKKFVAAPTNYEKLHNISITGEEIIKIADDMIAVLINKSDNTKTVVLFFKNSLKYDIWKFWVPSKSQMENIPLVYCLYFAVDKFNKQNKIIQ